MKRAGLRSEIAAIYVSRRRQSGTRIEDKLLGVQALDTWP